MSLKRTPLYDIHVKSGAKIVDFAGFEMPVLYSSLIKEHLAVRSGCGIFDVSHMGEIAFAGAGALDAVQRLTTNDARRLGGGEAQYSLICNNGGGVIDDVIVYCHGPQKFVLCVNASNTGNVLGWIDEHTFEDVNITDISDETALIALQGPQAAEVLQTVTDSDLSKIKKFNFTMGSVCGVDAVISRTGYTGEDGFELFMLPSSAATVWDGLINYGGPFEVMPVGLGARDTLRLEMGYPLHGNEIDTETSPLEAGLKWAVKLDGDDFFGKERLLEKTSEGCAKKLVAFEMKGPGIPRSGYRLLSPEGGEIGTVTSGTHSPSLKRAIGLGYVETAFSGPATEIAVEIRGKAVGAEVVKPPFYKK